MLNRFRNFSTGIGVKILMGLLIVSFAVWGVEDMVRQSSHNATVATIGDIKISHGEFAQGLRRETETLRRMLGDNFSPEIARQFNLEQRVLQRLVNHTLIKLESEALGLVPSDDDVVRTIRANPAFQDEKGNFVKAKLDAMLRAAGLSEKSYVEQLRQDIGAGLLLETVTSVASVPENAPATLLAAREEQRSVALFTLTTALAGAAPQPKDSDIEEYYKANARAFTAPEYRTVSYVALDQGDVKKTAKPSAEDLEKAYLERIDEFKKPERRLVEQLLFGNEEAARKAHGELAAGKAFDKVAAESNILNKKSLSLGALERTQVLEAAADKVFALDKGAVSEPVKSPFGWHIFRVDAILPATTLPLEDVRGALEKDLAQYAADNALSGMANKLEDAIAGGSTLKEAALALGLKTVTLPGMTKAGKLADGSAAKDIPPYDKFLDTAFKTDEKTESGLVTSKGGVFYIVRTESITPEQMRPLAEVKAKAVAGWQKEQQQEKLAALAKDISDAFAKEATRNAAIAKYNLSANTVLLKRVGEAAPLPPELVADIFAHAPGTATAALPGAGGDYVIALVQAIVPAPAPQKNAKSTAALADIRKELGNQLQDEVTTQYLRYLAGKYPVSINEAALNIKSDE